MERSIANIRSIHAKSGPEYEHWRAGVANYHDRLIAARLADLIGEE